MKHPEKQQARSFDTVYRSRNMTDVVYAGGFGNKEQLSEAMSAAQKDFAPTPSEYHIYYGDLHGHTDLSDAMPNIDTYFHIAKNVAGLDFVAVSDHDHGSPLSTELWKPVQKNKFHQSISAAYYADDVRKGTTKWDIIQRKVQEYNVPGQFTTILAYERDAYPWYNNLVIYFSGYFQSIPLGKTPGEITRQELTQLLAREDVLVVPHTTSFLDSGCDFSTIDPPIFTPLIEVYSRWGTDEYFGNPNPVRVSCRGGYWQDALLRGAKMGCIAGSDDHEASIGIYRGGSTHENLRYMRPGITAVLAKENTRESIFEALKSRRCYAMMGGGKIVIDFRINDHYMGEEVAMQLEQEADIYFSVQCETPIKEITLVKNCEDTIKFQGLKHDPNHYEDHIFDYRHILPIDFYYLRVETQDGQFAWTSPIWLRFENR